MSLISFSFPHTNNEICFLFIQNVESAAELATDLQAMTKEKEVCSRYFCNYMMYKNILYIQFGITRSG